jgi:hypothetical protein
MAKTASAKDATGKAKVLAAANKLAAPSTVASRLPKLSPAQIEAAQRKFEQGVVSRREAAEAGKPLPAGATHEISGRRPDGSPILKRKRFSAK